MAAHIDTDKPEPDTRIRRPGDPGFVGGKFRIRTRRDGQVTDEIVSIESEGPLPALGESLGPDRKRDDR